MKVCRWIIATLCALAINGFGQGTLEFRVDLDGAHAVPPNSSPRTALGLFHLEPGGIFTGSVYIGYIEGIDSVALFRSSSVTELGTPLFTLPLTGIAPPDGVIYGGGRVLSESESSDLQSGLWWVNIVGPGFPNGEMRGQVQIVPEPSALALVVVGGATMLGFCVFRRFKATRT